jgi:hypothetical protein
MVTNLSNAHIEPPCSPVQCLGPRGTEHGPPARLA